jgi:hypothetical protein
MLPLHHATAFVRKRDRSEQLFDLKPAKTFFLLARAQLSGFPDLERCSCYFRRIKY